MTIIIKIALFLFGMWVGVYVLAAFFRIIDLWYTINTTYLKVIRGILGWGGITVAIAVLLGKWQGAFLWGLGVFVSLQVIIHHGITLMLERKR
jgi:hypothetical protein